MKLSKLLMETQTYIFRGNSGCDPEITHLSYDSRTVKAGSLFFATDGVHTDGHEFIDKAIALGAVAIVFSDDLDSYNSNILYIRVVSPRKSLAPFASAFYGYPGRSLKMIGVTGTDGKSSTVSLICQLLELQGKKVGYLSTVAFKAGDVVFPNPYRQSTPEAVELQSILAQIRDAGSEYAVIEATSHGLSPKNNRLGGIEFLATVLTNVTQEHLEFHGTVEQYRKDKTELFKMLRSDGVGVVNANDPWHMLFCDSTTSPVFKYGIDDTNADCNIRILELKPTGSSFTLLTVDGNYSASIELPGIFNVENVAATWLTVYHLLKNDLNFSVEMLSSDLQKLLPIKGRMNKISHSGDFTLIVDYAHTSGAFEKLFPSMKEQTLGRLIVVFGSAGERDTTKRPIQGAIADQFADIIILTDEDPRLEDSMSIIDEIRVGCPRAELRGDLYTIADRKMAIEKAVEIATGGDTILLLGKGHESCMIYPEGKRSWDEEEIAVAILKKRGLM